jgi:peptidoglycan/LPS O-acetylase OafA/YrhL
MEHWGPPFFSGNRVLQFIMKYLVPDGVMAVDLFFVLSGFLITTLLLQARATNGNRLRVIGNFMMRRTLRIFPIYYLFILLLMVFGYPGITRHAGYYLTYTTNLLLYYGDTAPIHLPHTWSLAVEEQFYLFWPWLVLYVKEQYLKYLFVLAIIVGAVSCYVTNYVGVYRPPILVFNCMFCFGLGGLYAWCMNNGNAAITFRRWLLPAAVAALCMWLHWRSTHSTFWEHTIFMYRVVNGLIGMQVIVMVLHNRWEPMRKYVLENRVLNYLGVISYGLYLYHFVVHALFELLLVWLRKRYPQTEGLLNYYSLMYVIKLAILFAVTGLSYCYIESPLLGLKKRFADAGATTARPS